MISQVILFLLGISFIGILLLKKAISEGKLLIFLPAGMIFGVAVFIFLLNLVSKFFHGSNGILIPTLSFFSLGIFLLITEFRDLRFKVSLKRNLAYYLLILVIILAAIYFARLKMTSILPVADSNMQWAYAATFARGNYPIMAPWQPDLNPNYHLGAYFLEGAIYSIFGLPLITINSILNTFYLVSGVLFSMFIFWERKYGFKNIWLLIASLILYISYGVLIFSVPTQNFSAFTQFPDGITAKGTAGAALVDLNSLSYLPSRSLGLGLAFLLLYFTFAQFKKNIYKILSISFTLSTLALIEESIFLPIFLTLLTVFMFQKANRLESFKILLLTSIIVIVQGGFLSEFFNQKGSAFNIYIPLIDSAFWQQLQKVNMPTIIHSPAIWFIPSPIWLALLIIVYSLILKNKHLSLLGIFSLAALFCFTVIEYKYSPSNNIRFYNFAFIASGTGIFYLLYDFLKIKTLKFNLVFFSIISFFILIPTLLPEIINQNSQIKKAKKENTRSQVLTEFHSNTPFEEISTWASINLPLNSRLITIDTNQPVPNRALQFQYKGVYTVLGPQYIHTTRPEPGTEYFDLSIRLNPSLIKKNKAGYLYIESNSNAYRQLPEIRKEDLKNSEYFEVLKTIETLNESGSAIFFRLYRILPKYLEAGKDIQDGTLETLSKLITNSSTTYISDYEDTPGFSFWYRMAVILALKDKDINRNLSQTDYQAIETTITYKQGSSDKIYDYYILGPYDKPSFESELVWSNIYATCWKRVR